MPMRKSRSPHRHGDADRGGARGAGPDIAPFYTDSNPLAEALTAASLATADPLWRMPLFKGYEKDVTARIADLTNAPSGGMAGSITAALFLKRFVEQANEWAHFDIYGWSATDRPHGRRAARPRRSGRSIT